MEKFPRWRKALRANKPVVISDLQRLENVYPDEAAFFREYGVTTLLAAPFSKRINQGFIAVDDPTRYTDDPVFLFIASYAVVVELNEIKQQQSPVGSNKGLQIQSGGHPCQFLWRHGDHQLQRDIDRRRY